MIVSKDAFVAEGIEEILPANNNVGAAFYRGALYMGWRSAPSHFASDRWGWCKNAQIVKRLKFLSLQD